MAGTATWQIAVLGAIGRGVLTADAIAAHLPMDRHSVVIAVARLVSRHFVDRREDGTFQLTDEGGAFLASGEAMRSGPRGPHTGQRPPMPSSFRQRAWSAMRLRRRFGLADIITLAARDGDSDPDSNLRRWLSALERAGIVATLPARAGAHGRFSRGTKLFRLLRDTGPLAPAIRRDGTIFDHNLREVVPCRPAR